MKIFKLKLIHVIFFIIFYQIEKKLSISSESVNFVKENHQNGFIFENSKVLANILEKNKNPAILILNKV